LSSSAKKINIELSSIHYIPYKINAKFSLLANLGEKEKYKKKMKK
jgi:hypothetical protein